MMSPLGGSQPCNYDGGSSSTSVVNKKAGTCPAHYFESGSIFYAG